MKSILFRFLHVVALTVFGLFVSISLLAQSNVGSGAIQGSVVDSSGAAVTGAQVTLTSTQTGQVRNLTTNDRGVYNAGSLQPGTYSIEVAQPGFSTQKLSLLVQVGVTTNGNATLTPGAQNQVVEVTGDQVAVDTTQPTVQGVLTAQQIQNLPVDGRNFLNLAQLEPGVQLQDGQDFDPTKAGYSSVSFNGVNGRTARIELDGVDVSDETVGTTVLNITSGSIEEFQVSRSSLDASSELTSSGSINVTTKSGTNAYHGELFGLFRDRRAGFAASPGGLTTAFQRNQFGGSLGGAIIKDKLFFFANSERIKQDQQAPLNFGDPFQALSGGVIEPFRDTYSVGRLDAQLPKGMHAFYRFAYEVNSAAANFGYAFAVYANRDNTPAQAAGLDFNTGTFSHSFRFQYLKFHNLISDLTGSGSYYNPLPGAFISIGDVGLRTGPNLLAPQQTYQSNRQAKYDGTKTSGNHIFRYGASFNRITGGGFASFYGLGPEISSRFSTATAKGVTDLGNPLAYPIRLVVLGNGQGFFTEVPSFGKPAGGQQDDRLSVYFGDNWKILPYFTLSAALRYQRDTGRNDSDLPPTPCSAISDAVVATGLSPCTGSASLLEQFGPGLGKQVTNPNHNFGPQIGFAWDVGHNGKTVIRAGAGIYYENSIFNNTLFDRPPKLAKGLFFNTAGVCGPYGDTVQFPNADGSTTAVTSVNGVPFSTLCGQTIGVAGPNIISLQQQYQAAVAAAGPAANPSFIGNSLAVATGSGLALYSPNYKSTRSYQMNFGIQRELWKGGIFTADYIRNVGLHFPLTIDVNHVGAARFLNTNAALAAIAATTGGFGCAGTSGAAIDCAIAAGATITDFAGNGLDSGNTYLGGSPASLNGLTPSTGAAFPGANPLVGGGLFQFYNGRSVYNGLQLNFRQQSTHPMAFGAIKGGNFEASYSYSHFDSNDVNGDQNFSAIATDNDNPTKFYGPSGLDRTHQVSVGGVFDLKYGPRLSLISHFYSSLPGTLTAEDSGAPGEIFRTDFTGDGSTGDVVPGTNIGSFGRGVPVGSLNKTITNYNNTVAGGITPAGQALISAGLFSQAQLVSLGAVAPQIAPAPAHEFGNGILRTFDFAVSYPIRITERFHLEPSIRFFNLFNFANFGKVTTVLIPPSEAASGAAPGTVQGTSTTIDRDSVRTGNGSGTYSQGSPRQLEYGLRLTF